MSKESVTFFATTSKLVEKLKLMCSNAIAVTELSVAAVGLSEVTPSTEQLQVLTIVSPALIHRDNMIYMGRSHHS